MKQLIDDYNEPEIAEGLAEKWSKLKTYHKPPSRKKTEEEKVKEQLGLFSF